MTIEEARIVAEGFLQSQEMRGYKAIFADARIRHRYPNEFAVVFDLFKGDDLIDGPMVVIVDKTTQKARFFESP